MNYLTFLLVFFSALSLHAQSREFKYMGGVSAIDEARFSDLKLPAENVVFLGSDRNLYVGTLQKIVINTNGEKDYFFEGSVFLSKAQISNVTANSTGETKAAQTPTSQQGTRSGSPGGSSLDGALRGAGVGAAKGAAIYIVGEITKPDPQAKQEYEDALGKLAESQAELNSINQDVLKLGSQAFQSVSDILAEARDEIAAEPDFNVEKYTEKFSAIKNPELAKRGKDLLETFDRYVPRTKIQADLKNMGTAVTKVSLDYAIANDELTAAELQDLAGDIAGFITGLNPATSLIQDFYALYYNKNMFTGKRLKPVDRAMATVSIFFTIATGGLYVPIETGVLISISIAKRLKLADSLMTIDKVAELLKDYKILTENVDLNKDWFKWFSVAVPKAFPEPPISLEDSNK